MLTTLSFVLLFSQAHEVASVVTSSDLLKSRKLSVREASLAKKHRWILFGNWNADTVDELRDASEKIVRWRVADKAVETPGGGSESQKALIANWKSQLEHGAVPSMSNYLKDLLVDLKPKNFPLGKAPTGKWIKFENSGSPDLDKNGNVAARRIHEYALHQYQDPDLRQYMLLRRISGQLVVYLTTLGFSGNTLGLETVRLENSVIGGDSRTAKAIFPNTDTRKLRKGDASTGKKLEPVPAKDFDLLDIQRSGFLEWVRARVSGSTTRPIAVLASDVDLLSFVRLGGTLEDFLTTKGYQVVNSKGVSVVVPEFFDDVEDCRLDEQAIAELNPEDSCSKIISKYARWVANSGLMVNFDNLRYVEGALSLQRGLPNLSLDIFPLLPVLQDVPAIDPNTGISFVRLQGTQGGAMGDTLIHDRIYAPFGLGRIVSPERNLGYYLGFGNEQLRDVSMKASRGQRVQFKELAGLPLDVDGLSRNLGKFGRNWEEILQSAGSKSVQLVDGESVSITFSSTRDRLLSETVFFSRAKAKPILFKDLPIDLLAEIKNQTTELLNENDKTEPPPPPIRAVQ